MDGPPTTPEWVRPRPRARRTAPGELQRAFPRLHVDGHPAGDEILGLGERAIVTGGRPSPSCRTNVPSGARA